MAFDNIKTQNNINVENGVVITENNGTVNINKAPTVSAFKQKLTKYKEEAINNSSFGRYIDELNHFIKPVTYNPRNLETKLKDANRTFEIEEARELKAKFAKEITKNSFSEAAQDCYAHILAKLKSEYDEKVRPLVIEKASMADIEKKIAEVINIMYEELSDTFFEQNTQEIKGMLYYLTGNCHIEWS